MTRATRPLALLLVLGAIAAIAGLVGSAHAPTAPKSASAAPAPGRFASVRVVAGPAASQAASPAHAASVAPATVAGAAGMKIYKDAEGEIGPPDAGTVATGDDGTSQDMTGLQKVTLPDGSIMVDLQGRFQEAMVVQIDANGKRVMTCTRDVKETLSHPPVSPAQREER
jgi:hypothetical protein